MRPDGREQRALARSALDAVALVERVEVEHLVLDADDGRPAVREVAAADDAPGRAAVAW